MYRPVNPTASIRRMNLNEKDEIFFVISITITIQYLYFSTQQNRKYQSNLRKGHNRQYYRDHSESHNNHTGKVRMRFLSIYSVRRQSQARSTVQNIFEQVTNSLDKPAKLGVHSRLFQTFYNQGYFKPRPSIFRRCASIECYRSHKRIGPYTPMCISFSKRFTRLEKALDVSILSLLLCISFQMLIYTGICFPSRLLARLPFFSSLSHRC